MIAIFAACSSSERMAIYSRTCTGEPTGEKKDPTSRVLPAIQTGSGIAAARDSETCQGQANKRQRGWFRNAVSLAVDLDVIHKENTVGVDLQSVDVGKVQNEILPRIGERCRNAANYIAVQQADDRVSLGFALPSIEPKVLHGKGSAPLFGHHHVASVIVQGSEFAAVTASNADAPPAASWADVNGIHVDAEHETGVNKA
jgi:hypothetical protein